MRLHAKNDNGNLHRDVDFDVTQNRWMDRLGVVYECVDITHMRFKDDLGFIWEKEKETPNA